MGLRERMFSFHNMPREARRSYLFVSKTKRIRYYLKAEIFPDPCQHYYLFREKYLFRLGFRIVLSQVGT